MSYVVRPADLAADRGDILSVWAGSLPTADAEHYRWVYQENPFGPVSTWVVESDGRSVVGTATVLPRLLNGLGRTWRAGVTIDFAVARGHRTLGPALMLQKAILGACRERQFDLVYGFPIEASSRVQARAGFTPLGKATEVRKPLRTATALTGRYGPLAGLAAPLVDRALRLAENRVRVEQQGCRCTEPPQFDGRFDDLWQRVKDTLPLTGERTAAYLNWRFGRCPHAKYHTVALESTAGDCVRGYAVWTLSGEEFIIADLVADTGANGSLLLMRELLRRARELRVETVRTRCFGALALTEVQRRLGFRASESARDAVICVPPDAPISTALADRRNWFLLHGDTDV